MYKKIGFNFFLAICILPCIFTIIFFVLLMVRNDSRMVYHNLPIEYSQRQYGIDVVSTGESADVDFYSGGYHFERCYLGASQNPWGTYYFRHLKRQHPLSFSCYIDSCQWKQKKNNSISFVYSKNKDKGAIYYLELYFYTKYMYRFFWILSNFLNIGIFLFVFYKGKLSILDMCIALFFIIISLF